MSGAAGRGIVLRNTGIALAIVALAALAGVTWWRGRASGPVDGGGTPPATDPAGARTPDEAMPAPHELHVGSRDPEVERTLETWRERLGLEPAFPEPLHGAAACERVDAELRRVCAALDAGVGLEGRVLQQGSCAFVREVATRLAARPPLLPEGRAADAWLRNAFHLFRTLGSERIAAARRIVDAEPALLEPLALATYRWAVTRESCRDRSESIAGLTPARVYDYGAFAFTSFGGQANLRRRVPRLEALGCFYALSALELSIDQGHNPHGVDPRREIGRCSALVESQPFVWGDAYARELAQMASNWRRRTGGD